MQRNDADFERQKIIERLEQMKASLAERAVVNSKQMANDQAQMAENKQFQIELQVRQQEAFLKTQQMLDQQNRERIEIQKLLHHKVPGQEAEARRRGAHQIVEERKAPSEKQYLESVSGCSEDVPDESVERDKSDSPRVGDEEGAFFKSQQYVEAYHASLLRSNQKNKARKE